MCCRSSRPHERVQISCYVREATCPMTISCCSLAALFLEQGMCSAEALALHTATNHCHEKSCDVFCGSSYPARTPQARTGKSSTCFVRKFAALPVRMSELPMFVYPPRYVQDEITTTPGSRKSKHIEMYVATVVKPGQKALPAVRKMVPPPRQGNAVPVQQSEPPQKQPQQVELAAHRPRVVDQKAAAQNRAMRAEIASMASELQTKNAQLSKADAAFRHVIRHHCTDNCLGPIILQPPQRAWEPATFMRCCSSRTLGIATFVVHTHVVDWPGVHGQLHPHPAVSSHLYSFMQTKGQ